jgi:hypothetical protein
MSGCLLELGTDNCIHVLVLWVRLPGRVHIHVYGSVHGHGDNHGHVHRHTHVHFHAWIPVHIHVQFLIRFITLLHFDFRALVKCGNSFLPALETTHHSQFSSFHDHSHPSSRVILSAMRQSPSNRLLEYHLWFRNFSEIVSWDGFSPNKFMKRQSGDLVNFFRDKRSGPPRSSWFEA